MQDDLVQDALILPQPMEGTVGIMGLGWQVYLLTLQVTVALMEKEGRSGDRDILKFRVDV